MIHRTLMQLAGASLLAVALASPASAARTDAVASSGGPALYARARFADVIGERGEAASLLARASTDMPASADLALRSFRAAVIAGDRQLAIAALGRMERAGSVSGDAALLRLGLSLERGDAAAVQAARGQLAADRAFAFLVPAIDLWAAPATGSTPPAGLRVNAPAAVRQAIIEEVALQLLATGRFDDGVRTLTAALPGTGGQRALRLRIAGAAVLARAHRVPAALALLVGDDPALVSARALVNAGATLPGAVDTPAKGEADVLVRVAADLARDQPGPAALVLCRLATMLAPDDANGWIVTASIEGLGGNTDAAIAATGQVRPNDPLAEQARSLRVQLLARAGDKPGALAAAAAAAASPLADADDFVALGDAQAASGDQRAAAFSYGRARALATAARKPPTELWSYYVAEGGAWDQAGDWTKAEPLLVKAVELAPGEPVALNYLGYSRLERKVDVAAATKLIERAHALAPDNGAITDSLGWAHYLTGDLAGAVRTLGQAVLDQPGDPTINEHLGDAYWASGRRVEARYQWRAASVYAEPAEQARLAAKIADRPPAS